MKYKTSRRIVREKVLQILYAYEYNSEGLQALLDGFFSKVDSAEDRTFGEDLVNRTIIHKKDFDSKIESLLANWELSRIAMIDRLLLRMGICEFLLFPEIPPKATINELIEIAKDFSTADSGKFVNGILDKFLSALKKSGDFRKTGRGLLEETISGKSDL
ncbi:MAG: transcription antitermination factor NusB [Ignavibacteriaceae bacterium]